MGQKYSSQSSSGYNTSPPPDDGSTVAANKITWATIKSKLSDVLKTFVEAVNSQLVTALDYSATTTSTNYTTLASDHQKPIQVSATATISLGDATTMAAGYQVEVFNTGTGLVTVTPVTGTDTLNGTAGASVILPPFSGAKFCVNQAANGYNLQASAKPYRQGADIASASTINLRTATGDYVSISGTTTITAITLDKGDERTLEFQGALTLTNGASLILPGGANITTAAGDTAVFRGEASSVVRCIAYTKASGAPVTMSQITNSLSGDVNLNNTGNYFDGPSVAQGTAGTWLVSGTVSCTDTAGAASFHAKLWDGTTVIDSTVFSTSGASGLASLSLSGYLASPAGNLRISVKDLSSTSGKILSNQTGNSKDSTISAVRIG